VKKKKKPLSTKSGEVQIGLTLNETKTKLREARTERFDFLGYSFGPYYNPKLAKSYLGAAPSPQQPQAAQGQSARSHVARQSAAVAGSLPAVEPPVAGMAGVFRLWHVERRL
jgi:hypothetical protein